MPVNDRVHDSLSPFESRTTTLVVLWSVMIVANLALLIWCTVWP